MEDKRYPYIQDNIRKEEGHYYRDKVTGKLYVYRLKPQGFGYMSMYGYDCCLNENFVEVNINKETKSNKREISVIDIKAEPHIIKIGKYKENPVALIKYTEKFINDKETRLSEVIRYAYSVLVGDTNIGQILYTDVMNSPTHSFIFVEFEYANWDTEEASMGFTEAKSIDYYVRQLDGAKYLYKKTNTYENAPPITYTTEEISSPSTLNDVAGSTMQKDKLATFHIVTDNEERDMPSILDINNEILSVYIVKGNQINELDYEVTDTETFTKNIKINTKGTELKGFAKDGYPHLEIVVKFKSNKHNIDFYDLLYLPLSELETE